MAAILEIKIELGKVICVVGGILIYV